MKYIFAAVFSIAFQLCSVGFAQTCSSSNAGQISYSTVTNSLEWCNGEQWRNLTYFRAFSLSGVPAGNVASISNVIASSNGSTWDTVKYSANFASGVSSTTCTAAQQGQVTFSACTTACVVGNSGCGGKFAACDQGGGLYHLIAKDTSESGGSTWQYAGISNLTYATSASDGPSNTQILDFMTNVGGISSGASTCYRNYAGGFNDWYVPAENELSTLYTNRTSIGGFSSVKHWSSTEASSTNARVVDFATGTASSDSKQSFYALRCVRRAYKNGVPMICSVVGGGSRYQITLDAGAQGTCWDYDDNPTIQFPPGRSVQTYTSPQACTDAFQSCAQPSFQGGTKTCSNGTLGGGAQFYECENVCCAC